MQRKHTYNMWRPQRRKQKYERKPTLQNVIQTLQPPERLSPSVGEAYHGKAVTHSLLRSFRKELRDAWWSGQTDQISEAWGERASTGRRCSVACQTLQDRRGKPSQLDAGQLPHTRESTDTLKLAGAHGLCLPELFLRDSQRWPQLLRGCVRKLRQRCEVSCE